MVIQSSLSAMKQADPIQAEQFANTIHMENQRMIPLINVCIAKEIVKLHKGKLYVENTPDGGATFVISLPLYTY